MISLEKLSFTSYLLSVPEYNKQKLKGQVLEVKEILEVFGYPYNRRIAGAHDRFIKTMKIGYKMLKNQS